MTPALSVNLRHLVLHGKVGICALCYPIAFSVTLSVPQPLLSSFLAFSITGISFLMGMYVFLAQSEVLKRPFVYCLPGHRSIPQKIFSVVGITQSVFASLLVLSFPCDALWKMATYMLATFFISLTFFCICGESALARESRGVPSGILALIFLFLDLKMGIIKSLIFSYPICPIVICPFFLIFFWNQFHESVLTKTCRKKILDFPKESAAKKMSIPVSCESEKEEGNPYDRGNGDLGQFLLKRVQQSVPQSASQAFWGSLYELHFLAPWVVGSTLGNCILNLLIMICAFFAFTQFTDVTTSTVVSLFLLMIFIGIVDSLLSQGNSFCFPLLLRIGRRNYFRYLLVLWSGIYLVLLPALLFSLVGFFLLIGYFVPCCDVLNGIANTWVLILILGPLLLWAKSFSLAYSNRQSPVFRTSVITMIANFFTYFSLGLSGWFLQFKPLTQYFHSAGDLFLWCVGIAAVGIGIWILTLRRLIRRSDLV